MQAPNHGKSQGVHRALGILIADDEPDAVDTIAAVLADEGHVVHKCLHGSACVDAIQRYKPDICLIDIVMPGKTGFSIVRDVYALKLPKRPVLIALSGVFTRPQDDIVAKSAGFDYLIRKGSDPRELLDLIDRLAGGDDPAAA